MDWDSRCHHATSGETVGSLEKTNAEGPAIGPTGLRLERGKDPFGIPTTVASNDQNGNEKRSDTDQSPKDSKSLNEKKKRSQPRAKRVWIARTSM